MKHKHPILDRRFIIAVFSISVLFILGFFRNVEVAATISTIAVALGASNAAENVLKSKYEKKD